MLRYSKLEGCGNDFVVVDLRHGEARGDGPSADSPLAAAALCDRHFGVGADGVLAVLPAVSAGAVARMRVLNADGSEAEMCGNGIRCVAKYLYERDASARRPDLLIDTGAGPLRCGVTADGRRRVTEVSVAMGRPRLAAAEIPVELGGGAGQVRPEGSVIGQAITVEDRTFHFTAVSMGNPHAVIFLDDQPSISLRTMAERFGPALEHHPFFPRRTNVEFARRLAPGSFDLVVWERGCGITLACGTGACATAVAACLNRLAAPGEEIRVSLPGGDLTIQVDPELSGVTMRGPANAVFDGELDLASLVSRHQARHGSREAG